MKTNNISPLITTYSGNSTNIALNTSSTTSTFNISNLPYNKKLEGVQVIEKEEENFIEITYSQEPTYFTYPSSSKKIMLKEIYGVLDGKLQLVKTIKGLENPGYYVEPEIEWEE